MSARWRGFTVVFAAVVMAAGAGCSYWSPVVTPVPGAPLSAEKARITLRDGRRIVLRQVWVRSDSVGGEYQGSPFAIDQAQVARVEFHESEY
ncbi:MAG TPA: hypothetical protein VJN95_17885 [Gemmatimonadales bacterium]|nr:hypothetical protein [Gemmatimonadales bacterium]